MKKSVEISPTGQALMKSFELKDGRVQMSESTFEMWKNRLGRRRGTESLAKEVVAIAIKFNRVGAEAARKAIYQLTELAALVLGSLEAAQDRFRKSGMGREAFRYTGWTPAVKTNRAPKQGMTLFAFRVGGAR